MRYVPNVELTEGDALSGYLISSLRAEVGLEGLGGAAITEEMSAILAKWVVATQDNTLMSASRDESLGVIEPS